MAYYTELVERIRELLAPDRGIDEMQMFGGLASDQRAYGRRRQRPGRVDGTVSPDETGGLLDRAHVSPMVMAGREARGWLRVDATDLKTKRQLAGWVARGVNHVAACRRSQPRGW